MHSVIFSIALCMIAASAMGVLMRVLRLPLLLGYLGAGILIGPVGFAFIKEQSDIATVSEIGLILLLFMIGLEIDLKKMLAAGKLVVAAGVLQFPLGVGGSYLVLWALERIGALSFGGYGKLYFAIAMSLSSTMIVIKLLYDKFEIDILPGRITVGILVFQDIWAIIVLAVQPNLMDPQVLRLVQTFVGGTLLVVVSLLTSKYVLPRVFKLIAKAPELMLVVSLGWCFSIGMIAAHPRVGLSMEMGALIAGVALATFPYNLEVIGKVTSIRDFFITLFFVGLAMQIPPPELWVLAVAVVMAAIAILSRFAAVFPVLYFLRAGHRASLVATLNLSQVSEFSLVILSLGVSLGHIQKGTLTAVIWVFLVLAVVSTYLVNYSHGLQLRLSRGLQAIGIADLDSGHKDDDDQRDYPIVVLGFFRHASALIDEVARKHPHLLPHIKVVDFNPQVKEKLDALGVACVYGDIGHPDTLHHAHIDAAKVVLSTVPDAFLKGTSNLNVLMVLRKLVPQAKIIVTAEQPSKAKQLYDAGADFVLQPSTLAAAALVPVVEQALHHSLADLREAAARDLAARSEVLT